jgi:hypothetical protein
VLNICDPHLEEFVDEYSGRKPVVPLWLLSVCFNPSPPIPRTSPDGVFPKVKKARYFTLLGQKVTIKSNLLAAVPAVKILC